MAQVCVAATLFIPLCYLLIWFNVIEAHEVMAVHGSTQFIQSPETGPLLRATGFGISMIPQLAILFGLLQLRLMFVGIAGGEIFGEGATNRMRKFAHALVAYAVLNFIVTAPLSAFVTWRNPPGERAIQFSIGEGDFQTYFLIALFYVLTRIVAEGFRLSRENAEFV